MGLSFICIEDVHHLDTVRFKIVGNQRPMTTPPDRFCAHDGSRSGVDRKIEKALKTFVELFCLHVIGVTPK